MKIQETASLYEIIYAQKLTTFDTINSVKIVMAYNMDEAIESLKKHVEKYKPKFKVLKIISCKLIGEKVLFENELFKNLKNDYFNDETNTRIKEYE